MKIYFCSWPFFHSARDELFYWFRRYLSGAMRVQLIFPQRMHGVARRLTFGAPVLLPVEKLCTLCERGHVPCHTFHLPPSRQSERIPR